MRLGVFGTGLYSGDFAMDLRSTIRAVSRLPFDGAKLTSILRETEPIVADDESNEDHSTFWLVVADQYWKRGIDDPEARDRALNIIESGSDLAMLTQLGMTPPDLARRGTVLNELLGRLRESSPKKTRKTLQKPQPYTMDVGDVVVYPTWKGDSINPYMTGAMIERFYPGANDGWGSIVVVERGRAFEFLTWYRVLTRIDSFPEEPTLEQVQKEALWRLVRPGTCSSSHFKRMRMDSLGVISLDLHKFEDHFGPQRPGKSAAVNDISLAAGMETTPRFKGRYQGDGREVLKGFYHFPTVNGLKLIEAETEI